MTATEIQGRWGIDGALRFEEAPGGLVRAVVEGPKCSGSVYLYGAHVASWTPAGQQPVLYLSSRSRFERGMPIRGGVPIAFPWFGPRADGQAGPLHGFARIVDWEIEGAAVRADGAVELTLGLGASEASGALGFDGFHLRFRVAMGDTLEMELAVHNLAEAPLRFEEALHTYFSVANAHSVFVTGLAGTTFVDKTDGLARKVVEGAVRFTKETDQVHVNTAAACEIHDPEGARVIVVEKSGSDATVVWNPWIEKNRTLADMAPDDWQSMCCLETVNALENAVVLAAGGVHRMGTTVRVRSGAA